jgi:hypothetical protein
MDSSLSDYAEAARELSILKLLQDGSSTDQLLLVLERRTTITLPLVKLVVAQNRDYSGFSSTFLSWIGQQCQPFVAYRMQDDPDLQSKNNVIETSSSGSRFAVTPIPAANCGTSAASTTTAIADKNKPSFSNDKANILLSSKPKKRMTPNSVTGNIGSIQHGNIASTPSSIELIGPNYSRVSDKTKPIPSITTSITTPITTSTLASKFDKIGITSNPNPIISSSTTSTLENAIPKDTVSTSNASNVSNVSHSVNVNGITNPWRSLKFLNPCNSNPNPDTHPNTDPDFNSNNNISAQSLVDTVNAERELSSTGIVKANVTANCLSSTSTPSKNDQGTIEKLSTPGPRGGGLMKGISLPKASEIMKRMVPYSVKLVQFGPLLRESTASQASQSSSQTVIRMSSVLVSLVLNQYISFADVIPLLAKLCNLSLPGPKEGLSVTVTTEMDKFPTLLGTSDLFHLFAVKIIKGLLPVLALLGEKVALGFSESPVLRIFAPVIASELKGIAEDVRAAEVIEDINFSLPDNFIRPFREEIDSRNEYRTQTEAAAYNERERCFDDFSNLLRDFQMISRSDVDGSKTRLFWQTVLPVSGVKIISLRDCNFVWFSNIFMQMLLFHGLNIASNTIFGPRSTSSTTSTPSSTPTSTPTSIPPSTSTSSTPFGVGINGVSKMNNKNGLNGLTGGNGISGKSGISLNIQGDLIKQRKLEERMGPGGNG